MMKKILALLVIVVLAMATGCSKKQETTEENIQTNKVEETQKETVPEKSLEELCANKMFFTIEMQNGDVMKGEVYPDLAPETVKNFVALCDANFYEGLIFHRVIPGFMIQGGGFDVDMNQKEAQSIKGEFDSNGFTNPLEHDRGVLSMARTQVKDSASSQFFIMHEDAPHLDGQYAAFGKVTSGMDVVDSIAETKVDFSDRPLYDFVIKTIKMA